VYNKPHDFLLPRWTGRLRRPRPHSLTRGRSPFCGFLRACPGKGAHELGPCATDRCESCQDRKVAALSGKRSCAAGFLRDSRFLPAETTESMSPGTGARQFIFYIGNEGTIPVSSPRQRAAHTVKGLRRVSGCPLPGRAGATRAVSPREGARSGRLSASTRVVPRLEPSLFRGWFSSIFSDGRRQ